jgi:ubiquinone/menaquinone biosynthesis C-methylase UbiE
VKTKKCSLFNLDFPDQSFDVIWAEGAIQIIGFERGLREWKRLLKTDGFLVVHDDAENMLYKLEKIPECGYKLENCFSLPEDAWGTEYYQPLENKINELFVKYANDLGALEILKKTQEEIDSFKDNHEGYGSIFYIIKKL